MDEQKDFVRMGILTEQTESQQEAQQKEEMVKEPKSPALVWVAFALSVVSLFVGFYAPILGWALAIGGIVLGAKERKDFESLGTTAIVIGVMGIIVGFVSCAYYMNQSYYRY